MVPAHVFAPVLVFRSMEDTATGDWKDKYKRIFLANILMGRPLVTSECTLL